MNNEVMSLAEAARVCKVSPSTVRRRRDDLRRVGAVCEPSGWKVTLDQLIAVGLTTRVRGGDPGVPGGAVPSTVPSATVEATLEALRSHVATLEASLERERVRADMAEARLDRFLEAPPQAPQDPPGPASNVVVGVSPTVPLEAPQKRRWWQKLLG